MYDFFPKTKSDTSLGTIPNQSQKKSFQWVFVFFSGILIFVCIMVYVLRPPIAFPAPYFLRVTSGETLFGISLRAEKEGLVRSARMLQLLTILEGGERTIRAGDYYFDEPVNAIELARRLSAGDFNVVPIRVTLPEGMTISQMAKTISTALPHISEESFTALAKNDEGYLFPDTYFFSPASTVEDVYKTLRDSFRQKIASLEEAIKASGRSERDIIIMASIIERESNGIDDREVISGILWKRLDQGMLLQVDAPFFYLLGKGSAELTKTDLKINSPYNTYLYKGLPPTPIGAPGIASIRAALYPKESPYLFYLHDAKGNVYFARTFTEHQKNIRAYLK